MSVVAMWTPGATRDISGPKQLPHQFSPSLDVGVFCSSHSLLAPTQRTSGNVAGYWTGPVVLPAAMAMTDPLPPRPLVRARSKALVMASTGGPPPQELESTSASPSFQAQSIASAVAKSSKIQPVPVPLGDPDGDERALRDAGIGGAPADDDAGAGRPVGVVAGGHRRGVALDEVLLGDHCRLQVRVVDVHAFIQHRHANGRVALRSMVHAARTAASAPRTPLVPSLR